MSLLKNPVFYISFVIFFLIALYSFGWNFLGLWTYRKGEILADNYVKATLIDDTSVKITFLGIDLLKGRYSQYFFFKKVLDVIKESEKLMKLDVIGYLTNASDKSTSLEFLVIRMSDTIDNLKILKSEVNNYINLYNQKYLSCISQKSLGDTRFFYGLKNYDYKFLVEGMDKSVEKGGCAEKSRITMHVYQILFQIMDKYSYLLEKKYNIINSNQSLLIQNLGLFKDNYLDKLVSLKNAINGLYDEMSN